MIVHVFGGSKGIYGLTNDESGVNLPTHLGPWTREKKIDLLRDQHRIALDSNVALDDIAAKGWHITKPSILFDVKET